MTTNLKPITTSPYRRLLKEAAAKFVAELNRGVPFLLAEAHYADEIAKAAVLKNAKSPQAL